MSKRRTEYRLALSYSAEHYPELDEKLFARLGLSGGSGMGFGARDHSWYYPSLNRAVDAWRKIGRIKYIEDLRIERV